MISHPQQHLVLIAAALHKALIRGARLCSVLPTVLTDQATEIDVAQIENRGRMAIMSS